MTASNEPLNEIFGCPFCPAEAKACDICPHCEIIMDVNGKRFWAHPLDPRLQRLKPNHLRLDGAQVPFLRHPDGAGWVVKVGAVDVYMRRLP